jgi:hypothetical protein
MTLAVSVYIDWENNGTFVDESSRLVSLDVNRGRNKKFNSSGPEHIPAGTILASLENYDRGYDPYYSSGALYGYLRPGRTIKITATYNGVVYPVFYGYVSDIRPDSLSGTARISAVDGLQFLARQKCSTLATQNNISSSEAITDLLAMSLWPLVSSAATFPFTFDLTLGNLAIEPNDDILPVFTPDPSKTILESINEVAEAYGGDVFVTNTGSLAYHYRNTPRATRAIIDQSGMFREIEAQMPWDGIYNDIRVTGATGAEQITTDTDSISEFGPSTFAVSGNPIIYNATHAYNLMTHYARYLPEWKTGLRIRLLERYDTQLNLELLDRIKVPAAQLEINNYYQVGMIEHRFTAGAGLWTTLTLEPDYNEVAGVQTFPFTFDLPLLGWY